MGKYPDRSVGLGSFVSWGFGVPRKDPTRALNLSGRGTETFKSARRSEGEWNAPHVTAPLLEALKLIDPSRKAACLQKGLQRALELQRVEFVEMLLGLAGIDAMSVDLFRLYTVSAPAGEIGIHGSPCIYRHDD